MFNIFSRKANKKSKAEPLYNCSFVITGANDNYQLSLISMLGSISLAAPVTTSEGYTFYISSKVQSFTTPESGILGVVNSSGKRKEIYSFSEDYLTFANYHGSIANEFMLRYDSQQKRMLIKINGVHVHDQGALIKTQQVIGITPDSYYPKGFHALRYNRNQPWWYETWWPIEDEDGPLLKINGSWIFVNWGNPGCEGGLKSMLMFYKEHNINLDFFCGDLIRPQLV